MPQLIILKLGKLRMYNQSYQLSSDPNVNKADLCLRGPRQWATADTCVFICPASDLRLKAVVVKDVAPGDAFKNVPPY